MTLRAPEKIPGYLPRSLVYDFNQATDPGFRRDPWQVLERIRREAPPVFYSTDTPIDAGVWYVARDEFVREVHQNPQWFTTSMGVGVGGAPWPRKIIPLEVDPPTHGKYRALIAPVFSPRSIDAMEHSVRSVAAGLVDRLKARGRCEFLDEFARPLPSTILLDVMGLPQDRRVEFVGWVSQMFHSVDMAEAQEGGRKAFAYLQEQIQARYRDPRDDLITAICQARVDGAPMAREMVEDMVMFVFQAGLDTVTAGLCHVFAYLAGHPEKQHELIAEPTLIPNAIEEILRAYSWIGIIRRVNVPALDFHGAPMRHGDVVMTVPYAANRDPAAYERPDEVDFRREAIPHFAFGGGVHRCAGSHLARRELRVAVELWLREIGEFAIAPGHVLDYVPTHMFQLSSLPLVWPVRH
ncbi:MAG: cytochrome P450 [Gammaproteobacteria bacterium]